LTTVPGEIAPTPRKHLVDLKPDRRTDPRHSERGSLGHDDAELAADDPLNPTACFEIAEIRPRRRVYRVIRLIVERRPPDTVRHLAVHRVPRVPKDHVVADYRNMTTSQITREIVKFRPAEIYELRPIVEVRR